MPAMATCRVARARLSWLVAALAVELLGGPMAGAQTLTVHRLPNGTELVAVTLPLAAAVTVAWPGVGADGMVPVMSLQAGAFTVMADLETAFAGSAPPPVVVAVGGVGPAELERALTRLLVEPAGAVVRERGTELGMEGGVERRLGPPGAEALVRLELPLPPAADWRRPAVEVVVELLPELLGSELPGLQSRVEGERGLLELRVDPQLAEVRLRSLRFSLARIASEPRLTAEQVEAARVRARVRRQARLELSPEGAVEVVQRWLSGGAGAVRELLFGLEGVTPEGARAAAREWLPAHPGSAIVLLPPQVLSPRFASGPEEVVLDNDLAAALLERPASPLATLCLRPVLSGDVDGEMAATVLARAAAELRALSGGPPWIRVETRPLRLELAADAAEFAELCESLRTVLTRLGGDAAVLEPAAGDGRRLALQLMAERIGVGLDGGLSPSQLLRPDNLALGAVVADGEAAAEAVRKFLSDLPGAGMGAHAVTFGTGQRSRAVTPGGSSFVAVAVPAGGFDDLALATVFAELIRRRAEAPPDGAVEVLEPLVPGQRLAVVLVRGQMSLDELERWTRQAWTRWLARATDAELEGVRRKVAADQTSRWSGATGQSRQCAAAAAGEAVWQPLAQLEMEILGVEPAAVADRLDAARRWDALEVTAAGFLPPPKR